MKRLWTTPLIVTLAAVALLAPPARADASTYLTCGSQASFTQTAKPRDCFLGWPNLSLSEAIGLRRLAWHRWGGSVATAQAVTRTKVFEPWQHVTVRAFGRQRCGNDRMYTRVRVSWGTGRHTWSTPGCPAGDD